MTTPEIKNLSVAEAVDVVHRSLTWSSQLEQLAEECAELSQAALKFARILRGDNPTPTTYDEAVKNVREEATDVMLCLRVADIHVSTEIAKNKMHRWVERLRVENKIKEE